RARRDALARPPRPPRLLGPAVRHAAGVPRPPRRARLVPAGRLAPPAGRPHREGDLRRARRARAEARAARGVAPIARAVRSMRRRHDGAAPICDPGAVEPPSLQLVEDVLQDRLMWKRGVLALQGRPPDAASARAVILAFERGACEDWKAACLLGAIGHPDGYATALAILRSGDSTRASVYAGPALTKMWGAAAFADLAAILGDPAFDRRIHEGAAYGLAELADPRAVDVLMAAVDAKRVRMS